MKKIYSESEHLIQNNLAMCYIKLEQYNKAAEHAEMVMRKWPTDPKGPYRRGLAYMAKQLFHQAAADFQKVLTIDPSNSAAQKFLNECNRNAKKVDSSQKLVFAKMCEGIERKETAKVTKEFQYASSSSDED